MEFYLTFNRLSGTKEFWSIFGQKTCRNQMLPLILSIIVKKNMCVARMQQGSHGKKLHASVDLGKVVRINYDNFHLFFLPVSDSLFTNNYVM